MNQPAPTMTIPELAVRLGLDESTARRHLRAGKLPGIQIGSRWVVDRLRVERFLAGKEDAAGRPLIVETTAPATEPSQLPPQETARAWLLGVRAMIELLLKATETQVGDASSDALS